MLPGYRRLNNNWCPVEAVRPVVVGRCYYCNGTLRITARLSGGRLPDDYPTRDHVVPRCQGGRRTVPACHRCNREKGSMSEQEFRTHILRQQTLNP